MIDWDNFEAQETKQGSIHSLVSDLEKCDGWFIAGGYALSMMLNAIYGDIDVFFESEEAYTKAKEVYVQNNRIIHESTYATTFCDNVQFIHHRFGTPKEILEEFDLNICRVAYLPSSKEFLDLRGEEPNNIKVLNPNNYSVLSRVKKYLYRDRTIDLTGLKELRRLMTSEGLEYTDLYGNTVSKMDEQMFFEEVLDFKAKLNPSDFYKLFEDYDLFEYVKPRVGMAHSILFNIGSISPSDIIHVVNDNQRFAVLMNSGKLIGKDLEDAKYMYPEYFI